MRAKTRIIDVRYKLLSDFSHKRITYLSKIAQDLFS